MARFVNCSIVQDGPGSFSIQSAPPTLSPGRSSRSTFVVRVANVPDGIPDDAVKLRLVHMVDVHNPPALVDWSELN